MRIQHALSYPKAWQKYMTNHAVVVILRILCDNLNLFLPDDAMIPDQAHAVFVADLHLSANTAPLNQAFICLIDTLIARPKLTALYILGDWLDGWVGDDDYLSLADDQKAYHWLTPILQALKILSQKTAIYLMHGNRDFAIGQDLCSLFGGQLLKEPFYLTHGQRTYRLEHGDALCTDDKKYQRYRKIIRHPFVLWLLLKQPLKKRQQLAQKIKQEARHDKAQKTATIMDVNAQAVAQALQTCDVLIHGHTHRPDVHHLADKMRFVLGDWRDDGDCVRAVIGVLVGNELQACTMATDG